MRAQTTSETPWCPPPRRFFRSSVWGIRPAEPSALVPDRIGTMNTLLLIIVLLLLLGGGGFYLGGPVVGGSGIGLILLICLIIFLMGGFRTR